MKKHPKLIKDWRQAHRLWRVRLPLALAALSGVYSAWGSAQEHLPPAAFIALSALMSAALAAGHLFKLPGADHASGD